MRPPSSATLILNLHRKHSCHRCALPQGALRLGPDPAGAHAGMAPVLRRVVWLLLAASIPFLAAQSTATDHLDRLTTDHAEIVADELRRELLVPPLWRTDDPDLVQTPTHRGRQLQAAARYEQPKPLHLETEEDDQPDPYPDPTPGSPGSRPPLRHDDFIAVTPCDGNRLALAQASRYWRKGMRAVFVTDKPKAELPAELTKGSERFRESYAWFPSHRTMPDGSWHYLEGDRRAAMAPLLAYAALADPGSMLPWTAQTPTPQQHEQNQKGEQWQQEQKQQQQQQQQKSQDVTGGSSTAASGAPKDPFKWMLLGDDDTVFFMRGVKALLKDYDPQLPYFLSDSLYVGSLAPQPGVWDLRCFPCHLEWGRWRRRSGSRRLMGDALPQLQGGAVRAKKDANGCGCSTEALCRARFPNNVTRCMEEWEGPVPFGGVGYIMSIGLFKALAALQGGAGLRAYERCIGATSVTSFPQGGDAFLSRCLWRLGFPITDPGYTPLGRYLGEVLDLPVLYGAPANLSAGELPPQALARWSAGVSVHLGARQKRSFRHAAMIIKYVVGVYDLVSELLWPTPNQHAA